MIARSSLAAAVLLATSALGPTPSTPLVRHATRSSRPGLAWHAASAGVELAELVLPGDGSGWRTRVIVARLDPRRVALRTVVMRRADGRGAWSIDAAPSRAVLAVNAGQFGSYEPWGWVVRDGVELQPPGVGPLSAALVTTDAGGVRLVFADSIPAMRARGGVRQAVQSYPVLLRDGALPAALAEPGRGVDLDHRDARLALGIRRDGRVVVALTRFDALGETLGGVPVGPTVPEMAVVMRDLDCESAMLLDGGISAQLLVRDAGATRAWRGFRRVPVALLAMPR